MMEDYFKEHDEEVIANAKLIIIEEATPEIIEEATPEIIEEAAPKIIEDNACDIAKRLLALGVSLDDIQKATQLSFEQIQSLIQ